MKRTKLLQELLMLRYEGWQRERFAQEEAARLLGVSDRTFRRYLVDYKEQGLDGLVCPMKSNFAPQSPCK